MKAFDVCIKQAEKKKAQLDALRPLPPELIKNLEEWFAVDYVYNSNAIEGNTLTASETALVVEKGLTIAGKTVVEHLEAINHAYALDYIKELARDNTPSDNTVLKNIHSLILKSIDDKHAGTWRTIAVKIAGSEVSLADPVYIAERMKEFQKWLKDSKDHPIKKAAEAHLKFVTIHPFIDGNGRTARLLMNLLLMQNGYPPVIIRNQDCERYIHTLEEAQIKGDATPFYQFVCDAVQRSLDMWYEAATKTIT